ncbi:MAG: rhomboid family intramembrane serine protease [Actinomycetota bacterium]|nr:rhomboid family intramembrane serine protease [Actinomycetota bacterium]
MPGRYQFSLPERPSRDGWFRIGTVDVTTTALLVGLGVLSMFVYAIGGAGGLFSDLIFYGPLVRDGEVWRLVLWPIANPPTRIWVLLTLAFFWFVGHRIEDTIGRKRFTTMILLMTIVPAALVSLMDFTVDTGQAYGLSILAIALLVIFAFDSPGAVWLFNIPLWVLAAVFVLLDVLQYLGNRMFGALLVELGAIIIGSLTARQYGMLNDLDFIPRFGGGAKRSKAVKPAKRRGGGTGSTVVAGPWAGADTMHGAADQMELDGLLDKISASGMDSLSRSEKARLNELSKKLRGR